MKLEKILLVLSLVLFFQVNCPSTILAQDKEVKVKPKDERVFVRDDLVGDAITVTKAVCGCGADGCKCPKEDACDIQYYRDETQALSRQLIDAPPGSEEAQHTIEYLNYFRKELEEAEKKCNTPGDEPPPEDKRVCSCGTNGCKCLKKYDCSVQWYRNRAQDWSTEVMDAPPGSEEARNLAELWNAYRKGLEEAEKTCKSEPGGESGGGGGVSTAEPPPDDKPVCSCGGERCRCREENDCFVQWYRYLAQDWSTKVIDAPPGSQEARDAMERLEDYHKKLEEAEKKCK